MARLWLHDYDAGVPRRVTTVGRQAEANRSGHRLLAAVLVTIGSIGISVLSNVLAGSWQVLSFGVFAVVLVAGLVLAWTGRAG